MAIGLSIFLITIGAILRFGIRVSLSTLNFKAIGIIIMFAGAALLTIQLIFIVRARAVSDRRDENLDGDGTYRGHGYRDTTYRDDHRPPVLAAGARQHSY